VLIAGLILGLVWQRPTPGQAPLAPASKVGKYQVTICTSAAILCDTETGDLWMCQYDRGRWQNWQSVQSPTKAK
jgi:hypothetical protein